MSFELRVVEIREIKKEVNGKWVEMDNTGKRGYAPDREEIVAEIVERYSQIVETLDLVAVINAVNSIGVQK